MNTRFVIQALTILLVIVSGAVLYNLPLILWGANAAMCCPIRTAIIRAAAGLLAGSIATGLVSEALLRRQLRNETVETLREVIRKEQRHGDALARFGLVTVRDPFAIKEIVDGLRKGETLWWLDTYDSTAGTWINSLDRAIARGAAAKFLILDAKAEVARMRALEIARGKRTSAKEATHQFVAALEQFRTMIHDRKERHPGAVDYRQYADLPCAPCYLVTKDKKLVRGYSSYFLLSETNQNPHFEWEPSDSDSAFGHQLLEYVKQKWELTPTAEHKDVDERASKFPADTPVGYWIYIFQVHGSEQRIYGKFSVYEMGGRFRGEGEAFYFDQQPSRPTRRGLWRATDIQFRAGEGKLEVSYDMVIQNLLAGVDASNQYRGRLELHRDGEQGFKFSGDIYSIRGPVRLIGKATVCRLSSPAEIPTGNGFVRGLHAALRQYLGEEPYLLTLKPPAATSPAPASEP